MNRFIAIALGAATMLAPMMTASAQAGEVLNRELHQESRIYNGVKDGAVTHREFDHLEQGEARINQERVHDLRKDDGHLTASDRRALNRAENHESRLIYRDKHN